MVTHTFINIEIAEAKHLSDLASIEYDLNSAIQLSELLIKTPLHNTELINAITTATLVHYSRPFTSGVRVKLQIDDINSLNDNEKTNHERFINIRNKHIAHSVNTFEKSQVIGYYILEKPEENGITSISVQHSHIVGLSSTDTKSIIVISTKILAHISELIKAEKTKILSIVRQKNINDLIKENSNPAFLPDMSKPDRKRK